MIASLGEPITWETLDTYLHDNHEVAGTGISHSFPRISQGTWGVGCFPKGPESKELLRWEPGLC